MSENEIESELELLKRKLPKGHFIEDIWRRSIEKDLELTSIYNRRRDLKEYNGIFTTYREPRYGGKGAP